MFGTLHWNSHSKEAQYVERPHGSPNLERNAACDRCRSKKVKCRSDSGGCTRCKRLGRPCTFSSMKHGNRRTRHESLSVTQHEEQRQVMIQSFSPSTADDSSKGQTCLRPVEGEYDREREQGKSRELPIELSAENASSFDLSFLSTLGQQVGDQDGDSLPDFTFSPFPFLSSPESIISSTTSSGDSFSPTPSSATIFSDITPFEPCTTATTTSLFSYPITPKQSCQCLAEIVFAVEEFETSCNAGSRSDLDSIIAYQKKAIKCCRSMIDCNGCISKRENSVMLVFLTEKIISACEQIVALYHMKEDTPGLAPDSTTLPMPGPSPFHGYDRILGDCDFYNSGFFPLSGSIEPTSPGVLSDWRELLLGDYEISSKQEWEHLVRVLILLQLRAVVELLGNMKKKGVNILGEMQKASLVRAEQRVSELERNIYAF